MLLLEEEEEVKKNKNPVAKKKNDAVVWTLIHRCEFKCESSVVVCNNDGDFVCWCCIQDVNDNRPVFQPFANTLMVRENSPAPAVILTVEATDRDQGVYGQVRRNSFVINSLSPLLFPSLIF